MSNEQPAYLVISGVVVVSVALSSLPQSGQDKPSEVGGASCSQSHWIEANVSLSEYLGSDCAFFRKKNSTRGWFHFV